MVWPNKSASVFMHYLLLLFLLPFLLLSYLLFSRSFIFRFLRSFVSYLLLGLIFSLLLKLETGVAHWKKLDRDHRLPLIFSLDELLDLIDTIFCGSNHQMLAEFDIHLGRTPGVDAALWLAVQLPVAGQVA